MGVMKQQQTLSSCRPTVMRRDEESEDDLFSIEKSNNRNVKNVEENMEIIKVCLQQETKYQCKDYLSFIDETERTSSSINELCRQKMVEWCYKVVDYFDLPRRNVFVAMSCVDRFCSTNVGKEFLLDKKAFQLLCITCLHTSIKVHEPVEIALSSLITLCKGLYTEDQIKRMEQIVLSTIDWKMNPPVSRDYLKHFALLLKGVRTSIKLEVYHMACYLTESALCSYETGSLVSPFDAAMGSFITALSLYPDDISSGKRRVFFKTLRENNIYVCNMKDADQAISFFEYDTSLAAVRCNSTKRNNISTTTEQACSDVSNCRGTCNQKKNQVQTNKNFARSISPVSVNSVTHGQS